MASYFVSPQQLWSEIGTAQAPMILDVRRREILDAAPGLIPTATWHQPETFADWVPTLPTVRPIVVTCRYGHQLSQMVAADLRARGIPARVLEGGYQGWGEAGLPLTAKAALDRFASKAPSLWVTRRRPKIDRIACPWLIRRFVDPEAVFLFVAPQEVSGVAERFDATPFDVENVFWSHRDELCTFDVMVDEFGLSTEPLLKLARIVRGADTARLDLEPEASGLLAASLGLSRMYSDDLAQLDAGMTLYDAFYRWCRDAVDETHNWPSAKPGAVR
jgi:rhodanese-related sulfurtransferase